MSAPRDASAHDDALPRDLFGFDLEDVRWLERVRRSEERCDGAPGHIGDYEVLGVVGRGGQGVVYRARQPRTGREVVLKRLSAGVFATEDMRARFAREVAAASALDHPNIVTVYGSEEVDGLPVLAMQWIDGVAFDRWADDPRARASADASASGRTPGVSGRAPEPRRGTREILDVFSRICDAVQHAHRRGVIHRDLKPSNVLVDASGQPHVLDFGLAKIGHDTDADAELTHSGVFVGTPAYAAPELAAGRRRDVDVRTDVYALGVMLYQALTGSLPFEPSLGFQELLRDIQVREPRAPSTLDSTLDREIDAIVLKALSKEREQRYSSVEAFGADVERYLGGQAVLAHPPSTVYRARKFIRQHVTTVAVATTLLVALVATAIVSTLLYQSSERQRRFTSEALAKESALREEADLEVRARAREWNKARAAEVLQERLLSRSHRGAQAGLPVVTLREVLDQVAAELDADGGAEPREIEAWMRMSIGNSYVGLSLPGPARPHLERALAIRREVFPGDHVDVAESMEKLGRTCRALGDLDGADRMLTGALDMRRRLVQGDDGYLAVGTNSLGILKRHRRKYAEAEALLLESLEHYVRGQGPEDVSVPVVLKNLGLVYLDTNRLAEAEDALVRAHALAEKIHGPKHADVASCAMNLAAVWIRLERYDDAEPLCRAAIDTLVELHGDRSGMLAIAQERLAEVCQRTGRGPAADALLAEALESYRAAGNPRGVAQCLTRRASAMQELGRLEEAEASVREAVALACVSLGASDEVAVEAKVSLGSILVDEGCYDEAVPLLRDAQPILENEPTEWNRTRSATPDVVRALLARCEQTAASASALAR